MTIFKLQRPLGTNDPAKPWMLYDRDREVTALVPDELICEEVRSAVNGDLKAYFVGEINAAGQLVLKERIPDQVW